MAPFPVSFTTVFPHLAVVAAVEDVFSALKQVLSPDLLKAVYHHSIALSVFAASKSLGPFFTILTSLPFMSLTSAPLASFCTSSCISPERAKVTIPANSSLQIYFASLVDPSGASPQILGNQDIMFKNSGLACL